MARWLRRLYDRARNRYSLGHIRDTVTFYEGDDTLRLRVDDTPVRLMASLTKAGEKMRGIGEGATLEQARDAAFALAEAIFGPEQALSLMKFYDDNPVSVLDICNKYFESRLNGLIISRQKRMP